MRFTVILSLAATMTIAQVAAQELLSPAQRPISRVQHVDGSVNEADLDVQPQFRVNLAALEGGTVDVQMPTGEIESVSVTSVTSDDTTVHTGQSHNVLFTIVDHDGAVAGSVTVGDQVQTLNPVYGEIVQLEVIDPALVPECAGDVIPPSQSTVPASAQDEAVTQGDDISTIDVLVCYTPATMNAAMGQAGIEAQIAVAVSETNQAFASSGVNQVVRLVGTHLVDYTETGSFNTDLSNLARSTDTFMNEIHTLRSHLGADNVVLLCQSGNAAGIGYLRTNPSTVFSNPFSVVLRSAATGYYTFGHELGHNWGLAHDWDNSGSSMFIYSHGHRFYGTSGRQYRTIMAYAPGLRIRHYSNPNVLYEGTPTGIPEGQTRPADEARSLNEARFANAANMGEGTVTPPPPPTPIYRLSVIGGQGNEGDSGIPFNVQSNVPVTSSVPFRVVFESSSAIAGQDFYPATVDSSLPTGSSGRLLMVTPINDTIVEPTEEIRGTLTSTSALVTIEQGTALSRIIDNDVATPVAPTVNIGNMTIIEGNAQRVIECPITMSGPAITGGGSLRCAVTHGTTDGADLVTGTVTISIPAGATSSVARATLKGDLLHENTENFRLTLSSPVRLVLGNAVATVTVTDDDPVPSLTLTARQTNEPNTGYVSMLCTATISAREALPVTFNWTTGTGGTSTVGIDHVQATGYGRINAGTLSTTFNVRINGDRVDEPNETVEVIIRNITNAVPQTVSALGMIVDND